MIKALKKLLKIGHRNSANERLDKILTKDKEKRREVEARLEALDILVDIQTRGKRRR